MDSFIMPPRFAVTFSNIPDLIFNFDENLRKTIRLLHSSIQSESPWLAHWGTHNYSWKPAAIFVSDWPRQGFFIIHEGWCVWYCDFFVISAVKKFRFSAFSERIFKQGFRNIAGKLRNSFFLFIFFPSLLLGAVPGSAGIVTVGIYSAPGGEVCLWL